MVVYNLYLSAVNLTLEMLKISVVEMICFMIKFRLSPFIDYTQFIYIIILGVSIEYTTKSRLNVMLRGVVPNTSTMVKSLEYPFRHLKER